MIWRSFCLLWTHLDTYASEFYSKQCYQEAGMWLTSWGESWWLTVTKGIYAYLKCSQQPSAATEDTCGQSPFYQVVVGNHNKNRSSCPQVSSRLIKDISSSLCIEQNTKSSLYASWIHNSGNMHLHIHRTALVKVTHTPGTFQYSVFQDIARKLHYIHSRGSSSPHCFWPFAFLFFLRGSDAYLCPVLLEVVFVHHFLSL